MIDRKKPKQGQIFLSHSFMNDEELFGLISLGNEIKKLGLVLFRFVKDVVVEQHKRKKTR